MPPTKKATRSFGKPRQDVTIVTCANCQKPFEQTSLSGWFDIIMQHKPACSLECNKALGQVK